MPDRGTGRSTENTGRMQGTVARVLTSDGRRRRGRRSYQTVRTCDAMKILLVGMAGLYNRGCEAIQWGSPKSSADLAGVGITAAVGWTPQCR